MSEERHQQRQQRLKEQVDAPRRGSPRRAWDRHRFYR